MKSRKPPAGKTPASDQISDFQGAGECRPGAFVFPNDPSCKEVGLLLQLCIFEDDAFHQFFPLTLTRPVYELRYGMMRVADRLAALYPGSTVSFFCREELAADLQERNPGVPVNRVEGEELLLLNGSVRDVETLAEAVDPEGGGIVYRAGDRVAAVRCSAVDLRKRGCERGGPVTAADWGDFPERSVSIDLARYCWDYLTDNRRQLEADFTRMGGAGIEGTVMEGVHLADPGRIRIARGSVVKPGSVIDAGDGPVWIAEDVTVSANTVISGPVYIGPGSIIRPGARITGPVSLGPVCRIGGEVGNAVIQGYTSKQHDGYLGGAFLGEWINLGANTTNSDLKNNYSPVRAVINGRDVDTGLRSFGLLMGDHSKTAIGTRLNTGTVIGVCCNIFSGGFPPKFIPSFTWQGDGAGRPYELDKALATADIVMRRREISLTGNGRGLLESVYRQTASLRAAYGVS
ncbi:hypothetical protein JXO52_14565 [bacterium]|nr:hypothetical protein [bacterium]